MGLLVSKTGISLSSVKALRRERPDLIIDYSRTDVERWLVQTLREPIPHLAYPGETPLREPLVMLANYYSNNYSPPGSGMYIVGDPVSLKKVGLQSIDDLKIKDLDLRGIPGRDALRTILDQVKEVKLDFEIRDDKIFITAEKRK